MRPAKKPFTGMKLYLEGEWCRRHDECIANYYFWTYDYYYECSDASQEHMDKRQEQARKRHTNLHDCVMMGLNEWADAQEEIE